MPTHLRRLALLAVTLALTTVVGVVPAIAGDAGPFDGARWYVDPASNAAREADRLRATEPARAALFDRIAGQPQADWFGDWVPTAALADAVAARTATIRRAGALPVYVTYAIPSRDCGGYSAGGMNSPAAYRSWVAAFADGLDGGPAVVVVEPDALGLLDCLAPSQRTDRLALLSDAVSTLSAAGASVYLDAGHSGWHPAATMAERLRAAGVERARGFALNVSNFRWTDGEVAYAHELSRRTGGARAVVDTSRNGLGPTDDAAWCNPTGRALGPAPAASGDAVVDALLWIKRPGESDGTCNGGPTAGSWWAAYAEGLAARAPAPAPGPPPDADSRPITTTPAAPTGSTPTRGRPPATVPAGRIAGTDRVATALAAAASGWDMAPTVVLARSDDPADALAGTSLAGHLDAPLLVTPPAALDPRVTALVRDLATEQVVVLGGPAAVHPSVVEALRATGVAVRRVAGASRTATAADIATEVTGRAATALLVHDRSWADALAVSGLAARRAAHGQAWPVLLAGDDVPAPTMAALDALEVRHVVVVGGTAALPRDVDTALRASGRTVERLAGSTRHDTSLLAATRDLDLHGGGPLLLATSAGFADGLAAGALAARLSGTVVLVPPHAPDTDQVAWASGDGRLTTTHAIGGTTAVDEAVRRAMQGR